MSRSLARILLAVLLVPLAAVVYLVTWFLVEYSNPLRNLYIYRGGTMVAGAVTWVLTGSYWILLWRRVVRWSVARVIWTALMALLAVLFAATLAAMIVMLTDERYFGYFLASVLAPLLWMIGTVLTWRETANERRVRLQGEGGKAVICPQCGYNMTGLAEARCPECGSRFTLDQLLAEQPERAGGEVQ